MSTFITLNSYVFMHNQYEDAFRFCLREIWPRPVKKFYFESFQFSKVRPRLEALQISWTSGLYAYSAENLVHWWNKGGRAGERWPWPLPKIFKKSPVIWKKFINFYTSPKKKKKISQEKFQSFLHRSLPKDSPSSDPASTLYGKKRHFSHIVKCTVVCHHLRKTKLVRSSIQSVVCASHLCFLITR